MYTKICACSPHYFNSVSGICFACGGQGVLTLNLRPLSQSNCPHGGPYFDLVANRCVVCGTPGVPVPQQAVSTTYTQACTCPPRHFSQVTGCCLQCGTLGVGQVYAGPAPQQSYPVGGGPYHIAPPVPMPMPNLIPQVAAAIRAGFNAPSASGAVKTLEKMEPPKPTEEELLKRANDTFPVLTAKELLCHRCCAIMKPRISARFSINNDCLVFTVEVVCHGVAVQIDFSESDAGEPMFREAVVDMLQALQGKTRDDWTF